MKPLFLSLLIFSSVYSVYSQVGIGTVDPHPSSILEINSPNKGFLVPRVSLNSVNTSKLDGTNNAAEGLLIYNTNGGVTGGNGVGFYFWKGSSWTALTPSDGGGGSTIGWSLSGNSVGNSDFLGTTNWMPLKFKVQNRPFGQFDYNGSIALGIGSGAGGNGVSIGTNSQASSTESVAIGYGAKANYRALALGLNSFSEGTESVAIGYGAKSQYQALALGWNAQNLGTQSVAIGYEAKSNYKAVALGWRAQNDGNESVAIGHGAKSNYQNIAIGVNANASANDAVVIGSGSSGTSQNTVVIGKDASAFGNEAIAMGNAAKAEGANSMALGNGAIVSTANQIVLGNANVTEVRTSGLVRAARFISTTPLYPDYVFEKYYNGISEINDSYTFKTLDETEDYVKKNGHLPGVKSYQEIKYNDFKIDLTETSITNLEKIEEQFLFIAELNTKLKAQQSQIDSQQREIDELKTALQLLLAAQKK